MIPPNHLLVFGSKRVTRQSIRDLNAAGFHYCYGCKTLKPIDAFSIDLTQTLGFRSRCMPCMSIYNRKRTTTPEYREKEKRQRPNRPSRMVVRKRTKEQRDREEAATRQRNKIKYQVVNHGIYVLRMQDIYKIGKSSRVCSRVASLAGFLPYPTDLAHVIHVAGDLRMAERSIHALFQHCRLNGEWFRLSDADLAQIMGITEI